ncbi:hypothetical protein CLOLEP_02101 [[Clostridium] leptum DSM 753]|uniref:Uncharacterized protein n=1 Tax=[Clostridium] leptum DSM 753 TaxID=428125 RepID=A7VU55_9FIRM|nr:hypothetical protein CLOLEP_02101 [[Clostridium] leptum DSM 753]
MSPAFPLIEILAFPKDIGTGISALWPCRSLAQESLSAPLFVDN